MSKHQQPLKAVEKLIEGNTLHNSLTPLTPGNATAVRLKEESWQMIETSNFLTIKEMCSDAQENSRFFGIAADSGYGKTASLFLFRRRNSNVIYLLADVLMNGKSQFLKALQKSIGIKQGDSPSDLLDAIITSLNARESPLLIIDDAGKLSESCLRIIQLIYDRTERRCGIIISGTPYLKLHLEKGVSKNKMGFQELYRRIELWQKLQAPHTKEIIHLCKANQLKDEVIIKAISRMGKNYGTVRAMVTNALKLEKRGNLNIELLMRQTPEGAI